MTKVILDMAMSVDGFIAGLNDEDWGLHDYFFSPSSETARVIEAGIRATGAIVMGRRSYDLGDQFDGFEHTPYKVPHLVLSHGVPKKPAKGETEFIFVTDGIESALRQAKAAAGDRDVVIGGGASTTQQFLKAGLIDEIQIHLVPKLLGQGMRLFDHIGSKPIQNGMQKFSLVWFGQLVSCFGTAATRFALLIWAYDQTNEATTLALLGSFSFITYALVSLIAGV